MYDEAHNTYCEYIVIQPCKNTIRAVGPNNDNCAKDAERRQENKRPVLQ